MVQDGIRSTRAQWHCGSDRTARLIETAAMRRGKKSTRVRVVAPRLARDDTWAKGR
ncbi:MAG: hypothetical protein ACRYHA_12255 [Janthinobacterium lividum]